MIANNSGQFSGEYGGNYFADASAHNGNWSAIYALTATVVGASTSNIAGLNGFPLAAGQIVHGVFNSVTLTSGTVIAYNRKY